MIMQQSMNVGNFVDETCKQAIFRKVTKRTKRVRDLRKEEIKTERELDFFNTHVQHCLELQANSLLPFFLDIRSGSHQASWKLCHQDLTFCLSQELLHVTIH